MSMWVLISFSLRGLLPLLITVCSYKKLAIFTTNVHTKNECLINYKTVIRSTKPPISCRCCYRLAFLSVVGYNHFYVVRLFHLSSAFLSGLCVECFIFLKRWKKYFEILFWVGEVKALLQFLVCALACANCKCACF